MNVNAAGSSDYIALIRVSDPDPVALPLPGNAEEAWEKSPPHTPGSSLSGIEKQFAGLIRDLSQQMSSLEKQLMQALGQLGGTQARKSDDVPPAQVGYPGIARYGKIITDAARRHEVDPLLVNAVINQESGFRADAVSKAGATGLMQLMPDTARSLGVTNALDPKQNVEGGTTLLRQLLDRYNGQVDLALAAYNAGPEAVDRYGGLPPYPETQAYVRNVMQTYREAALSA